MTAVLQFPLALDALDALNAGENRYRQLVLGQGPLPGYPVVSDIPATRRDRGHADALSHYVVEAVRLTIREVAERLPEFTSDDVREALPKATAESLAAYPQVLGALFRAMAVAGEIVDTGRVVRSRHEGARKRKVAVWSRGMRLA